MANPVAAAASAEPVSGGLPQFDFGWWPGEIVWMLLIFGVLYLLFSRVFVPRIGNTISDREDRIAGDIGDARRMKSEAEAEAESSAAELAQARAVVQKRVLDARSRMQADSAARTALEDVKLAEILAKAEIRITATRDAAMAHVQGIADEAARLIVDKLVGSDLAAPSVEPAVKG